MRTYVNSNDFSYTTEFEVQDCGEILITFVFLPLTFILEFVSSVANMYCNLMYLLATSSVWRINKT